MKKNDKTKDLPHDIAALLAETPETTPDMLHELAMANQGIVSDSAFIADLECSKFVDAILSAMQDTGITRSQLAREINVSRQYIQKVLNEDARVSFTLKTMVNLCHALGKELRIEVVSKPTTSCASNASFTRKNRASRPPDKKTSAPQSKRPMKGSSPFSKSNPRKLPAKKPTRKIVSK